MKSSEIEGLRTELDLDPLPFARLCGVDVRTVTRWEMGEACPTGASLAVLVAFRHALQESGPLARLRLAARLRDAADMGGLPHLLQRSLR